MLKSKHSTYVKGSDSIRFIFKKNILVISTRKDNSEKHSFKIVSQEEEIINGVTHTVLTSNKKDVFYIVNDQFHRENDLPAITCRRSNLMEDKIVFCKMWIKNGRYHRDNDKPALIWKSGDLMWMIKGSFKRNPFENISIYLPDDTFPSAICHDSDKPDNMDFISDSKLKEQQNKGLVKYSYSHCG